MQSNTNISQQIFIQNINSNSQLQSNNIDHQYDQQTRMILQQNTTECQQLAKIDFLQQEIKQLREENNDIKKLLKQNKEQNNLLNKELQACNQQLNSITQQNMNMNINSIINPPSSSQQQGHMTTNLNSTNRYNQANTTTTSQKPTKIMQEIQLKQEQELKNQRYLQSLTDNLFGENEKLYQIIEKVARERDNAQGKALINEQIALGASEHEMQIIDQLSCTINSLQDYIKGKDLDFQELQESSKNLQKLYANLVQSYKNLQKYIQTSQLESNNKMYSPKTNADKSLMMVGSIQHINNNQEQKQLLQQIESNIFNNQSFNVSNANNNNITNNVNNSELPQNSPKPYGTVVRYKEILNPSNEVLKLQTRLQIAQQLLRKTVESMEKYRNEKNELMAMNTFLSADLLHSKEQLQKFYNQGNQLKILQSTQTLANINNINNNNNNSTINNTIAFNRDKDNNSFINNSSMFIQSKQILKTDVQDIDDMQVAMLDQQKKLVGQDDMDSSFDEENLPDKVVIKKPVSNQNQNPQEPPKIVPKLDIGKAQKFQDFCIKKAAQHQQQKEMKMQQQQIMKQVQEQQLKQYNSSSNQNQNSTNQSSMQQYGNNSNFQQSQQMQQLQLELQQMKQQEFKSQEKINKLNDEILNIKICVQEQMMLNKVLIEQADDAKRDVQELEERNNLLISANKRYEDKWQKVFHSLYFYREYYISDNKYFLQSKIKSKPSDLPLLLGPGEQFKTSVCNEYNVDDPFFSPESLVRFIKKKENQLALEHKVPQLLELNDNVFEILSHRERNYQNFQRNAIDEVREEDILSNNNMDNTNININIQQQQQDQQPLQIQQNIQNQNYNNIEIMKCKNQLLEMAKDIYQNQKLQKLSNNYYQKQTMRKRSKSCPVKKSLKSYYMMPLKLLKNLNKQQDAKGTRVFKTQTMTQHNKRKLSKNNNSSWNKRSLYDQATYNKNNNSNNQQIIHKNYRQNSNKFYADGLESPIGSGEIMFCPEGIPQKMKIWNMSMGMPSKFNSDSIENSSFMQDYQYKFTQSPEKQQNQYYSNNSIQMQSQQQQDQIKQNDNINNVINKKRHVFI